MSAVAEPTPLERIRAGGGVRVSGPSALSGDWRRIVHLTWTLAYTEWRLKFFGSVLGYVWQLARPLAMFAIFYVIFTHALRLGNGMAFYAPALLMAILLYQFFAEVTGASVGSVVGRENLVRKIHFPRIVIPLSIVLQATFNLVLNLVAVGFFIALAGVPLRASWLQMIPLFAFLVVFVAGLAMLLSALYVRYRDVQPIWEVVTQAMFYGTPIIYPITTLDAGILRDIILLNPLALVVQQMKHAMFDPEPAEHHRRDGCELARRLPDRPDLRDLRAGLLDVQPRRSPRRGRPLVPTLWTIGYEALLPPALVAELEAAGIERLIDVRFRPQSRRPGMSKTRLGALLAEHGISYEHRRELGTPPDIRWFYKHGRAAEGAPAFRAHVESAAPEALDALAAELRAGGRERP